MSFSGTFCNLIQNLILTHCSDSIMHDRHGKYCSGSRLTIQNLFKVNNTDYLNESGYWTYYFKCGFKHVLMYFFYFISCFLVMNKCFFAIEKLFLNCIEFYLTVLFFFKSSCSLKSSSFQP